MSSGNLETPRVWSYGARRLRPQDGAARAGQEPGLDEERQRLALRHRLAVEALDREPLRAPNRRAWSTSAASAARSHSASGSSQRHHRPAAALDEERGRPPSRTTWAPATRAARAPARFGHGSTAP